MGMGKKSFIFIVLFSLLITVNFTACKKNKKTNSDTLTAELTATETDYSELAEKPQNWHVTGKKILVILGYGFNEAPASENLINVIEENFGLSSEEGLVKTIIFPDDFKRGIRSYPSELYSKIQEEDENLSGIIILGAPENTHIAFARNQDNWNQEVPYPVIALFPQDEVLGLESTCDIVLDKGHTTSPDAEILSEEIANQLIEEAPEVLVETIKYIQDLSYSLEKDSTIQTHLVQMLKNKNIHHYIDPETGLQSINHFVLN